MRDLRHLLVVIKDDTVIAYGTSISGFIREVRKIEPIKNHIKSDSTMNRYFKKNKILVYLGKDKKIYTLQKVL